MDIENVIIKISAGIFELIQGLFEKHPIIVALFKI